MMRLTLKSALTQICPIAFLHFDNCDRNSKLWVRLAQFLAALMPQTDE